MKTIRRALARVAGTVRGRESADDDLRMEMEAHLEMEIEANLRRGMSPAEARRQALIAAGGLAQAAESVREERGLPWVENLVADLRYAARHFGRTPLATLTMILVLSLGIGTTVVLFTVLSSLATLPAPGIERDASRVRIRGTLTIDGTSNLQERLLSWPEVEEYAGRSDLFATVSAYADETALVETGDETSEPIVARLIYTTPSYFSVLDVQCAGRGSGRRGGDQGARRDDQSRVLAAAVRRRTRRDRTDAPRERLPARDRRRRTAAFPGHGGW